MKEVYRSLFRRVALLSLGASICGLNQGIAQIVGGMEGQNDHPSFLFTPESPMTLGKGFDIQNPAEERQICGNFQIHYPENRGALSTQMSSFFVSNSRDLKRSLGIDLRIEARVLFASTEDSASYNSANDIRENAITFVLSARTEYGRTMVQNFTLNPEIVEMLRAPGGTENFRRTCGTHYVTTEYKGDVAAVFITLNDVSEDERTQIRGSIRGGVNVGIASGSVSGSLESIVQSHIQSRRYTSQVFARGGAGTSALAGLVGSAFESGTGLVGIRDGLRQFMAGFSFDSAVPLRMISSPFVALGVRTNNIEDIGREEAVQDLADLFRTYRTNYYFVRSLYGRIWTEENDRFLQHFPENMRNGARAELPTIRRYLSTLTAAYHRCAAATIEQLEAQCVVPAPPSAPNFEAFRAFRSVSAALAAPR